MGQHDVHKELLKFYEEHVRLGDVRRKKLAAQRDACLERVKAGLKLLAEKRKAKYRPFARSVGQGSYPMYTLNQHPKDEYDIDVALVFASDDLPATALDARKLVAEALLEAGGGFQKEPEARTNAVTVWYADGTHVDLAIYREIGTFFTKLEHAGSSWGERDPEAITEWFRKQVDARSPGVFASVATHQLRRVVRWVKAFARSRPSWSLPGGMILTALVTEVYAADSARDDIALYQTLLAMRSRLASTTEVYNPVNSTLSLTSRPTTVAQMKRLGAKLDFVLAKLAVIVRPECTHEQALGAWQMFFNHAFWGAAAEVEGPKVDAAKADVARIPMSVGIALSEGARTAPYSIKENRAIPKQRMIHFTLPEQWRGVPNATYRWTVQNSGDEAVAAKDLGHARDGEADAWREARYQGVHTMTCEVVQSGKVIARGVRRVEVARW